MPIVATVTTVYATAFALAPLAQLKQITRSGSSDQVSLFYFGALAVNLTLWLVYGVLLGNYALIVSNVAGVATTVATVVVIRHYRTPPTIDREGNSADTGTPLRSSAP